MRKVGEESLWDSCGGSLEVRGASGKLIRYVKISCSAVGLSVNPHRANCKKTSVACTQRHIRTPAHPTEGTKQKGRRQPTHRLDAVGRTPRGGPVGSNLRGVCGRGAEEDRKQASRRTPRCVAALTTSPCSADLYTPDTISLWRSKNNASSAISRRSLRRRVGSN